MWRDIRLKVLLCAFFSSFFSVSSVRLGASLKRAATSSGDLLKECSEEVVPPSAKNVPTFQFTFNDETHQAIDLHWLGKDSKTLIVVSTTTVLSLFGVLHSPSSLWRSTDGGRHYSNLTAQINADPVSTTNALLKSPVDDNLAVITAIPVHKRPRSHIYITHDAGAKWELVYIPFKLVSLQFNKHRANLILADSAVEGASGHNGTLYLSKDYGKTWTLVVANVASYEWGLSPETVYVSVKENSQEENLKLIRTDNLFKTYKVVASNVHRFVVMGDFLFVSVNSVVTAGNRGLYVSKMKAKADNWQIARLPEATSVGLFSILYAVDGLVLVHVDDVGGGHGKIFISDSSGTFYSKVLSDHVYTSQGSSDFYEVKSMRGTFITTVIVPGSNSLFGALVSTRISFDRGARWQKIQIDNCKEADGSEVDGCSLHIHSSISHQSGITPQLPASDPGAPGLVIAHGNTGSAHSKLVDIYVSRDGGYNWVKVLEGPHYYVIADQGKLLVAVPTNNKHQADTIYFSENHGACWSKVKFSTVPWHFTGMQADPKAMGMKVTLWGYTPGDGLWQTMVVDFSPVIDRPCNGDDYEEWVPHAQGAKDGCLLGFKERIKVIKQDVWCYMPDKDVEKKFDPCPCDLEDFECDFGYVWNDDKTKCIVDSTLPSNVSRAALCSLGQKFYNKSIGYRRIPDDKCKGGDTDRLLKVSRAPCLGHVPDTPLMGHKGDTRHHRSASIVVALIFALATVLVIAYVVYKFALPKKGGRYDYRYTSLRTSLENDGDSDDEENAGARETATGDSLADKA